MFLPDLKLILSIIILRWTRPPARMLKDLIPQLERCTSVSNCSSIVAEFRPIRGDFFHWSHQIKKESWKLSDSETHQTSPGKESMVISDSSNPAATVHLRRWHFDAFWGPQMAGELLKLPVRVQVEGQLWQRFCSMHERTNWNSNNNASRSSSRSRSNIVNIFDLSTGYCLPYQLFDSVQRSVLSAFPLFSQAFEPRFSVGPDATPHPEANLPRFSGFGVKTRIFTFRPWKSLFWMLFFTFVKFGISNFYWNGFSWNGLFE